MLATRQSVTVEEYLSSSFEHDMELIDGQLKERPMPTPLHAFVQGLLCYWFVKHTQEWGLLALPEARTQVRSGNFRLPDISIVKTGAQFGKFLDNPPLIALEILSPEDTFSDLLDRASDLSRMGVEHVWLFDPENHKAYIYAGGWRLEDKLSVPNSPVYLDLEWLWSEVNRHF